MFTGLISDIGRIEALRRRGGAADITVSAAGWTTAPEIGESIAVQGVCLTVTSAGAGRFRCDLLNETLDRSTLGRRRPGDRVNLERALRAGDRLGGHLVSGHIDGQGICSAIARTGPDYAVTIRTGSELLAGMVPKGSVACDGVSLTIANLATDRFTVHVIPHTWSATTLQSLRIGDSINIETDLLGKHAASRMAHANDKTVSCGITIDTLRRSGFDA